MDVNGRQIIDKIKKLHETALRIVWNDTVTSFESLLIKDKFFTTHHQNIQSLAIKMKYIKLYMICQEEILANFL